MVELKKTANGIQVAERELPVMGFYDVVVIGGGVAGVAAGMAAGKRGMKTIILETFTALGGLTTLGLVNIPLDFVSGLGREMFDELEKVDGLWHRNTDPEKHKLVLDRMVKKYNCEVLFHSQVIDSIVEGDAIVGVVIQTKTGPKAIQPCCFPILHHNRDFFRIGCKTLRTICFRLRTCHISFLIMTCHIRRRKWQYLHFQYHKNYISSY